MDSFCKPLMRTVITLQPQDVVIISDDVNKNKLFLQQKEKFSQDEILSAVSTGESLLLAFRAAFRYNHVCDIAKILL